MKEKENTVIEKSKQSVSPVTSPLKKLVLIILPQETAC